MHWAILTFILLSALNIHHGLADGSECVWVSPGGFFYDLNLLAYKFPPTKPVVVDYSGSGDSYEYSWAPCATVSSSCIGASTPDAVVCQSANDRNHNTGVYPTKWSERTSLNISCDVVLVFTCL